MNKKILIPVVVLCLLLIGGIAYLAVSLNKQKEENAAIKEFRLKHLLTNHETAPNRKKVLELLKNRPLKLKHYNLRRILKNYPNMNLTKKR